MRTPHTAELLDAWDNGQHQPHLTRVLRLVQLTLAGEHTDPASLPVGLRDARLLMLRERLFGPRLQNQAICPACSLPVEWETQTTDLLLQEPDPVLPDTDYRLTIEGYQVRFRLPDSTDLAGLTDAAGAGILLNCITEARLQDQAISPSLLPASVLAALDQRMAELDPQADVRMQLSCPECRHRWEAHFDITTYLWKELDNWAVHLLRDIRTLAGAFGWSEDQVLRLSPFRRQAYINLILS
jgi:hypothetical protein